MNHLFLVRTGIYGPDGRLDNRGRLETGLLGKDIKDILNGSSAHIITSSAPRAVDSAQEIAECLNIDLESLEKIQYLWFGTDSPELDSPRDCRFRKPDLERIMKIVDMRKERAEGIIIVSHLEVTDAFPAYFLSNYLGVNSCLRKLYTGQAVHFDLTNKSFQYLPKD